jgi:hypothetical protein
MRCWGAVALMLFVSFFGIAALFSCGGGGSSNGNGTGDIPGPSEAFVTSVKGAANLGSWTDAGGLDGLAAADAVCQARADAAGLTGHFVAWMSDTSNDAYCRVLGLSGLKSSNCGQVSLPTDAGPWVRTDGFAFAATISQLTSGVIYTPLRYDEFGSLVSPGTKYFTGTKMDGTLAGNSCSDWSSTTSGIAVVNGHPEGTGGWWTNSGTTICSIDSSIACLEVGEGDPLPSFASTGKVVFVTSVTGDGDLSTWTASGNLSGITGGDAICRSLANSAGLANTVNFKAWLSDGSTNAGERLTSGGPWVRLDGVEVASDQLDLTDGSLFAPINVTENMEYDTGFGVWTGTQDDGTTSGNVCSAWADTGSNGTFGVAVYANSQWSESSLSVCTATWNKIYCFED